MGAGSLTLLDYRRRTAALYAAVRAESDPAQAHRLWRRTRDLLFAEHPDSPLLPGDPRRRDGLPVARYDPDLRFAASLEAVEEDVADRAQRNEDDGDGAGTRGAGQLVVTTGTDGTVAFSRLGRARTPLGTVDVWWLTGYGGGLWVPVRDASSGARSYGGGRYLLDTAKGADLGSRTGAGGEELVLDLNFLYNPSCAYDPSWACPLAPPGNRLEADLAVGELDLPS